MLQAYKFSWLSPLRNPPAEQCFLTSLQRPIKQIKSTTRNQQNKHFRWFCKKVSASADSFTSSDSKPTRKHKPLGQIFCGTFEHGSVLQSKDDHWIKFHSDLWRQMDAFYRFSRPHTVIGTIIGITSISTLPLSSIGDLSPTFFVGLLKELIPAILVNVYVVGINQLFDVEIDKVNKPNLPLASGEYSLELGTAIVVLSAVLSFTMSIMLQSPPLFASVLIWFLFGTAYSVELPFLRWKRNPFLAAACILIGRAISVQLAFFLHMQIYVLGRPMMFTRSLGFAIGFMCLFTIVIAVFKDIPDLDGDRDFGIQSFTVSLGQKRVFWLCISTLLIVYGTAMVLGASSSCLLSKLVTVLGHCTLASILWLRAQSVNLQDNASITSFYMFIWKLFYAEYLLIPFVR